MPLRPSRRWHASTTMLHWPMTASTAFILRCRYDTQDHTTMLHRPRRLHADIPTMVPIISRLWYTSSTISRKLTIHFLRRVLENGPDLFPTVLRCHCDLTTIMKISPRCFHASCTIMAFLSRSFYGLTPIRDDHDPATLVLSMFKISIAWV